MKKSIIVLVTIIMSSMYSCSKEESNTGGSGCVLSDATLVGSWGITKIEIGGRDTTSTIFQIMPCYKTLVTEFKTSKIATETNSGKDLFGQSCSVEPDKNWIIVTNNSRKIIISSNSTSKDTAIVESFDCKNLVVTRDGLTVTLTKK